MTAALRLWWLLRGTCPDRATAPTLLAFGLLTWSMLTAAVMGRLAASSGADAILLGAMAALLLALALTAVVALHTLLVRCDPRRSEILRMAGASRGQAAAVSLLEVGEAALPGVVLGVLAHLALGHLAGRAGVDLAVTWSSAGIVTVALMLAMALVVSAKVRLALRGVVA